MGEKPDINPGASGQTIEERVAKVGGPRSRSGLTASSCPRGLEIVPCTLPVPRLCELQDRVVFPVFGQGTKSERVVRIDGTDFWNQNLIIIIFCRRDRRATILKSKEPVGPTGAVERG